MEERDWVLHDDEEEEEREEANHEPAKPWLCPECPSVFSSPEDLGVHIERHRKILPEMRNGRGRVVTVPCPRGCGRNFPLTRGVDIPKCFSEHTESCDGSRPVPPIVLAQGA